jgi:hypothetical protein
MYASIESHCSQIEDIAPIFVRQVRVVFENCTKSEPNVLSMTLQLEMPEALVSQWGIGKLRFDPVHIGILRIKLTI